MLARILALLGHAYISLSQRVNGSTHAVLLHIDMKITWLSKPEYTNVTSRAYNQFRRQTLECCRVLHNLKTTCTTSCLLKTESIKSNSFQLNDKVITMEKNLKGFHTTWFCIGHCQLLLKHGQDELWIYLNRNNERRNEFLN